MENHVPKFYGRGETFFIEKVSLVIHRKLIDKKNRFNLASEVRVLFEFGLLLSSFMVNPLGFF